MYTRIYFAFAASSWAFASFPIPFAISLTTVGVCYLASAVAFTTPIDLIHGTIFDYVIHFQMAKAHERPYATVCKAVSKEA